MRESDLYEKLLAINDGSLEISLKNNPMRITIIGRGHIEGETLEKILKLVNKNKANLDLTSYGVIQIVF